MNISPDIKKDNSSDDNLKTFSDAELEREEVDGFVDKFKKYHDMFGKSCFRDIGCFSATEYDESARDIPLLPMSPDSIAPLFHMYTLEQRTIPRNYSYNATADQLRYSTFNASLRTAFIVHGFQSGYSLWLENMKDYIFYKSNDQFNVVVVIWEKGARTPLYNLAASNTRVVGALIGFFINSLCKTFNITNNRFWLIGHSLGAHVMGFAGKRLNNPQVARITALDPAGVAFHSKNTALRLDHSDAQIVDVIHTDAPVSYTEGFGTSDTLGHFDFYPNGGSWQPGCAASDITSRLSTITSGDDISCSRSRAWSIMNNLEKPEDECSAVGYQCENYGAFLEGRCANCADNKCQPMGLNPDYWTDKKMDERTVDSQYYYITTKWGFISQTLLIQQQLYMYCVMNSIRDASSAVFCPKDGSETRIVADKQKVHYIACNPVLKHKCRDLLTEELKPLTFKEDIHSVDYMRQYSSMRINTIKFNIKMKLNLIVLVVAVIEVHSVCTDDMLGKTCYRDIGCFSPTEYNESAGALPLLPMSPDFIAPVFHICFRDIGCFSSDDNNGAALPLLPMSPDSMAPVFHMYTQEHRTIPRNYSYNATADQLRYSTFNASLRTAFIVHGFRSGYSLWLE
ncbi:unnamed protein product, partial [Medioppia subpectinata]